jgi:hypothetical protein
VATAVPTNADGSVHNAAPCQTTALHTHGCERTTARRTTRPWGRRSLRNSRAHFRAASRTPNRNSAHLLLHNSPVSRDLQTWPSDAQPRTAWRARRCKLTVEMASRTSSTCHPFCTSPCTEFANNQRLITSRCQQLCAHHGCEIVAEECADRRPHQNATEPTQHA